MIDRTWLPVLFGLLGLCYGLQCPKQKVSPGREVVCYTSVSDVDRLTEAVCKCTTLVQQGYDVQNLSISEFENFRKSLKEISPTLQFVISIDDPGKTLRTSGTVRQEITARLIGILKEVDGIELNMTAGSKERLVHFAKGLKDEMVRKSYDTRIFMALPTKPEELAKQFDLKELSKYVDLFTIPTDHLVEDDEAYHTFHPSRLMGLFDMFNADNLIDLISGLGVPKRKILMSLPSTAYEFTLKDQDDNAPRAPTENMQPVIIDQKQLCDLMKQGVWTVERDEDLTAPYAFKNKTWIAFDDKISVGIKGKYVLLRELPGLAIRDVENDSKTKCGMSLTYEINHSFMDFKRKSRAAVLNALEDELHQTQLSYPTQVKSSDFRVVRVVDTEGHIRVVRENTQTEFTCNRQGYFVHPKSCNRFYRCVKFNQEVEDYSVFEFDCPAGLAFDETTEVCVWPGSLSQGSPCPGSSEIAPVTRVRFECPSTPGYYADPQNPRWFFACIDLGGPHMMAYEFRCPFSLIFDEHKLACEWPWLVEGYSGTGYTRTEYDNSGYGTGSTPGTGGYYTGALPDGYSGSTGGYGGGSGYQGGAGHQGGVGSQGGAGYQSGAGYQGGVGSQGGAGYQGGVGSQGGAGYQGGSGYQGGAGYHGGAGSQGGAGYQGGSGYQGGAGYHGGAGSQGGAGYQGTTGYHGAGGAESTGTIGKGSGFSGAAGVGYSGSTVTGGYQGSTGRPYGGSGISYTGTTGGGYQGSGAHGGSGTQYTVSTGGEYQGPTGGAYGGSGISYTGSATGGYQGSGAHGGSGTQYTVSTGGEYQGPTGGAHGGSGISYTGAIGGGYTGSTSSVHGGSGTQYTGSAAGGYAGSTSSAHGGSGTQYTGSATGGYQGSGAHGGSGTQYTGSAAGGYAGSTSSAHGGSGTQYTGSATGGYQGSGAHGGSGTQYTGSTGGEYQGPTGGAHGGSGISYTGATAGGYTGSTSSAHGGSGTQYTGSAAGGYTESGVYVGSTEHSAVTEGYRGSGVKGGHAGSPGAQYPGPSYGTASPGFSGGVDYSASPTGQTGTKYSGYDIGGIGGSSAHGQTFGTSGSGTQYFGATGSHGQIPESTYVQKPDGPRYNCVTCTAAQPSSGQTYVTDGYLASHGASGSGATIYQGTTGYTSNVTLGGSYVPSAGGPTYHVSPSDYGFSGGADSGIITGHNVQGSIVTGSSSPGTLVTYSQTPGAILSGSSEQGTIVTGGSYPGYTQTGAGTPGYVISGGVKTVYPGSASPGTIIHGAHTPGVLLTGPPDAGTIIKGQPSPGVVLTGQTAPGVSLGGAVEHGAVIGNQVYTQTGYTTQHGGTGTGGVYGTKTGSVPSTYDTGYKINEYHDNGGRGTIRFNNGDVTTKYTENDIPDYRPAGGTIPPDTLLSGGVSGTSTPSGFTKTGITKTGFTTATLGGGGSYVIGTQSRPTPKPENIGEKAFAGNVAGYTKSSTESTIRGYPNTPSTQYQSAGHDDTSRITLGPSKFTGYSYPRPNVPFVTGVTSSPTGSVSPTEGNVLTATTPTPFLNVEVYNSPKFGTSTPGSPAVVKTYQRPTGFVHVTSPATPIYTTGPLENYKTTIFEAAKIPIVASTVRPVIDNGYKTIISSTPIPVTLTHDQFGGNIQTGSGYDQTQFGFGTKSQQAGYGQKDYISGTTPSSVFEVPSNTRPQINYGSPGSAYFGSTSKNAFEQQYVTPSSISESLKPQTQYIPSSTLSPAIGVTYRKPFTLPNLTPTPSPGSYPSSGSGSISGGSPTNVNIPRDEVGKLITNYNRGTTKYVPSEYDVYSPGSFGGSSSSSTFGQGYGSTPSVQKTQFPVGTFSGGYSKPSSISTYQSTAKSTAVGKGKVIVKWSDLHPLLLGKLGAECTCRGDPFANLRGPGSRLINSSKGKVDLSSYDESEIYVDLEKEGSYEKNDYVTNYDGPVKIWNDELAQVQEKPSSTYLPSVTPSANLGAPSQNLISGSSNRGFTANFRSGKSLSNFDSSFKLAGNKGQSLDQQEPVAFGDSEEIIDGATNCARPGLFRHPNFCNKFYACHWDEWKKKFTLHTFNCPVHLTFDNGANACNWPSMGPACQDDNLLV